MTPSSCTLAPTVVLASCACHGRHVVRQTKVFFEVRDVPLASSVGCSKGQPDTLPHCHSPSNRLRHSAPPAMQVNTGSEQCFRWIERTVSSPLRTRSRRSVTINRSSGAVNRTHKRQRKDEARPDSARARAETCVTTALPAPIRLSKWHRLTSDKRSEGQAATPLLNGTSCLRENSIGVGTYQPYCTDHNNQDHSQQDCILSYVLAFVRPNRFCEVEHGTSPPFLRMVIVSGIGVNVSRKQDCSTPSLNESVRREESDVKQLLSSGADIQSLGVRRG
jgi:hypothetical protein